MSFLEQLGKKLSDVGQEAAQQTKNLADRAKLSNAIFEREKQIRGWYAEIGRAYFLAHSQEEDTLCPKEMASIREAIAANEADRQQLDALRGGARCPSCGAAVAEEAQFCSSCGAKLSQGAVCEKCGQPLEPGA